MVSPGGKGISQMTQISYKCMSIILVKLCWNVKNGFQGQCGMTRIGEPLGTHLQLREIDIECHWTTRVLHNWFAAGAKYPNWLTLQLITELLRGNLPCVCASKMILQVISCQRKLKASVSTRSIAKEREIPVTWPHSGSPGRGSANSVRFHRNQP